MPKFLCLPRFRFSMPKWSQLRYRVMKCKEEERMDKIIGLKQKHEEIDVDHIPRLKGKLMLTETAGPNQTGEVVPVKQIESERMKCLQQRLHYIRQRLHYRVIGQNHAIDVLERAVLKYGVGVGDPERPIGAFLFLGSAGVGKTELAKALAESLFDDENLLVHINMSEYTEHHSVFQLFGAPLGHIGHEMDGQLTEVVRRRPYSVILFDKVEKAHVAVLNTLLRVIESGWHEYGQWKKVDFTNTIIIMTSNIGVDHILAGLEGKFSMEIARERVMEDLRSHLAPKLRYIVDKVVIFDPLSHEQLRQVASLQMKNIAAQFAERAQRDIALDVTDAAFDIVLSEAYNPVYGAGPIRRWLEKKVVPHLSRIMREEIDGNITVHVDAAPNKMELQYTAVEKNVHMAQDDSTYRGRYGIGCSDMSPP